MPTVNPFRPEVEMKSYPIPPVEPRDVRQRVARLLLLHAETHTGKRTSITTGEMSSVMGINKRKVRRAMIKLVADGYVSKRQSSRELGYQIVPNNYLVTRNIGKLKSAIILCLCLRRMASYSRCLLIHAINSGLLYEVWDSPVKLGLKRSELGIGRPPCR